VLPQRRFVSPWHLFRDTKPLLIGHHYTTQTGFHPVAFSLTLTSVRTLDPDSTRRGGQERQEEYSPCLSLYKCVIGSCRSVNGCPNAVTLQRSAYCPLTSLRYGYPFKFFPRFKYDVPKACFHILDHFPIGVICAFEYHHVFIVYILGYLFTCLLLG